MPGQLREIRRRIRSVQSTAKITHAMELVAASKMRRAQQNAIAGRPYAEKMRFVLADLAETIPLIDPDELDPLLRTRPEKRAVELVLVTPDRGLSGGLPATLNRRAAQFILEQADVPVRVIAVGKKGRDFMRRTGQNVVAEFIAIGDYPGYEDVRPIAQIAAEDFVEGRADEVVILYARFVNTVVQRPEIFRLLPVEPPQDKSTNRIDYIYEPGRAEVLAELLPRYIERQVYDAVLEAIASEQSARMVAMRNATDNANELIRDLTLVYNKARQESITSELLDITGGVEALRT
ncbi:MAG: ATP synthase F1 subunit gamma [Chloroflexi bacterium]|nr:MAG: ATP synthase F1 subunit gamma [Chloroflexota bacterium]